MIVILNSGRVCSVDRNPWYWWPKWYGLFHTGNEGFISAFTLRSLLRKLELGLHESAA